MTHQNFECIAPLRKLGYAWLSVAFTYTIGLLMERALVLTKVHQLPLMKQWKVTSFNGSSMAPCEQWLKPLLYMHRIGEFCSVLESWINQRLLGKEGT